MTIILNYISYERKVVIVYLKNLETVNTYHTLMNKREIMTAITKSTTV